MSNQELPVYYSTIHDRPVGAPRIYKIIEGDYGIAYIKDGKFHRDDGPAFISVKSRHESYSIVEEYLVNGKWHNEKGPAIVYFSGRKRYFLNDKELGTNILSAADNIQYIPSDEYWIKFCKLKSFQ